MSDFRIYDMFGMKESYIVNDFWDRVSRLGLYLFIFLFVYVFS